MTNPMPTTPRALARLHLPQASIKVFHTPHASAKSQCLEGEESSYPLITLTPRGSRKHWGGKATSTSAPQFRRTRVETGLTTMMPRSLRAGSVLVGQIITPDYKGCNNERRLGVQPER